MYRSYNTQIMTSLFATRYNYFRSHRDTISRQFAVIISVYEPTTDSMLFVTIHCVAVQHVIIQYSYTCTSGNSGTQGMFAVGPWDIHFKHVEVPIYNITQTFVPRIDTKIFIKRDVLYNHLQQKIFKTLEVQDIQIFVENFSFASRGHIVSYLGPSHAPNKFARDEANGGDTLLKLHGKSATSFNRFDIAEQSLIRSAIIERRIWRDEFPKSGTCVSRKGAGWCASCTHGTHTADMFRGTALRTDQRARSRAVVSVTLVRRKPPPRARENTRISVGGIQAPRAARPGATTAPSNTAIHVVPKRPSLRVYDPFYACPPAARRAASTPAPLFTDREGKQPSSVTCYCSYANRLHSWSTRVVHARTLAP